MVQEQITLLQQAAEIYNHAAEHLFDCDSCQQNYLGVDGAELCCFGRGLWQEYIRAADKIERLTGTA